MIVSTNCFLAPVQSSSLNLKFYVTVTAGPSLVSKGAVPIESIVQGHPRTVFCKISVQRSKYCLEFSFT